MTTDAFTALADELADRDPELPARLVALRIDADRLREHAAARIGAFTSRARERGADHLLDVEITRLKPDEKHPDALEFSIERGRWRLLCVAIAARGGSKVRVVGPFKRGADEGPCKDAPTSGPEVESLLDERMLELLRTALGG